MGSAASVSGAETPRLVGPHDPSNSNINLSVTADGYKSDGSILRINELLKDVRFAHHFKNYILSTYKDDAKISGVKGIDPSDKVAVEASSAVAKKMAVIAYNYFQFYLDVTDFEKFTDSTLRIMRADAIVQTYLVAAAKHRIPIPKTLLDAAIEKLDGDRVPPSDTFVDLKQHAQDYLDLEVYSMYIKNTGSTGYKAGAYALAVKRLRQTFRKPSKEEASLLDTVLLDPAKTDILKDYLTSVNSAELLFVFLELLDIKQMMAAVIQISKVEAQADPEDENSLYNVGRRFVLARINRLYYRHLRVGSTFRDIIPPDDVYEALTLTPAAIDSLVGHVFDILSDSFLDFLKEANSTGIVKKLDENRAERQKEVEAYAKQYEKTLTPEEVQTMPLKGVGSPRTERGLQALEKEARDLLNVLSCNKDLEKSFLAHLAVVKRANLVFFWRDVEDFKSIPIYQQNFIQGRAEKLFDKYCKRGAVSEIPLTLTVRTEILTKIFRADISIFDNALKDIITTLLPEYIVWQVKRSQPTFSSELRDLDFFDELKLRPSAEDKRKKQLPISFLEVLTTPSYCNLFKQYAESEFCVPALLLWSDMQEWKELPPAISLVETRYRKIYNKYIKKTANMPVFVSEEAKLQADLCINQEKRPFTFELIENEVFKFLQTVLLPKFMESELYSVLVEMVKRNIREDVAYLSRPSDDFTGLITSIGLDGAPLERQSSSNYFSRSSSSKSLASQGRQDSSPTTEGRSQQRRESQDNHGSRDNQNGSRMMRRQDSTTSNHDQGTRRHRKYSTKEHPMNTPSATTAAA